MIKYDELNEISQYSVYKKIIDKKNITQGIFQKNIYKDPSFVTAKGSSYSEGRTNEKTIFDLDDGDYWSSAEKSGQYITLTFNKIHFQLKSLTLLRCMAYNCIYKFDVLGSNDNSFYQTACQISTAKNYFMGEPNNIECLSPFPYKYYRLKSTASTSDGNPVFLIYFLEFFGYIYIYDQNFTQKSKILNSCYITLICILVNK